MTKDLNQAYAYRTLEQLREAGVCGTRRMCGVCRRYTNFAPGAVLGVLPSDGVTPAIRCQYTGCLCWISIEPNLKSKHHDNA